MMRLVLGGERSGKSAYALRVFAEMPGPKALVATGLALDASMRERIERHRRERTADVALIEAPDDLVRTLAGSGHASLLVEGLDFWLYRRLCEPGPDGPPETAVPALVQAARDVVGRGGRLVLVSLEAGLGPLAMDGIGRRFVREMGGLNQALAGAADAVDWVVAGISVAVKGPR